MIETSQNELTSLLDILNIKKDDKLLIHSSLYSLGKMNFNKKRFLENNKTAYWCTRSYSDAFV